MAKNIFLVLTAALALSFQANAQKSPLVYQTQDGAIKGYDPVAYFKQSKPVKGEKEYSVSWQGATWYFQNQQNRDEFKSNPEKYAPQYGGYCAYGTANGHKAPTEPDAFTIVDGKLYLNYNKDVMANWRKDTKGYIVKANEKWPMIKDQE